VPYIRHELHRLGKPYIQASSYSPEILGQYKGQFDCLLICGSQGNYPIDVPAAAIMRAGAAWITRHIDDPELDVKSFSTAQVEAPPSGLDWYYPYELDAKRNADPYREVWLLASKKAKQNEERRRTLLRELSRTRRAALEWTGE
jgi:hypothetical protein